MRNLVIFYAVNDNEIAAGTESGAGAPWHASAAAREMQKANCPLFLAAQKEGRVTHT